MNLKFRFLRADEVECRVAQATEKGVSLLLYKDARCDMNILDETVGPMNWTRHHSRENANCTVAIWDYDKQQWIEKEDTGTESNTEAEKGLASDSFKRACFNWGVGRELYTAPYIWVKADDCTLREYNGKWKCYDKFDVSDMRIEAGKIVYLVVSKKGKAVYTFGQKQQEILCECCGKPIEAVKAKNGKVLQPCEIKTISVSKFGKTLCAGCQRKALEDIKKTESEEVNNA